MTTVNDQPEPVDTRFLEQAVQLALDNVEDGEEPFGAVVARNGEVLGTGVNTTRRDSDPTAHAEIAAVREACRRLGTRYLEAATVFSSCEPCPMCLATCAAAGIDGVVYAAPKESVPDLGTPPRPLLAEMQAAVRPIAGDRLRHVPTPGADRPFARWLELVEDWRALETVAEQADKRGLAELE
ncbi:MAG: nucleoside deaminase [Actinomycetota bacterium]